MRLPHTLAITLLLLGTLLVIVAHASHPILAQHGYVGSRKYSASIDCRLLTLCVRAQSLRDHVVDLPWDRRGDSSVLDSRGARWWVLMHGSMARVRDSRRLRATMMTTTAH